MVLALALVDKEAKEGNSYDPVKGHILPSFPFHIAQEIMTRCDFIRELDSLNLMTITSRAEVRASSVPMHRAFQEICSRPRFRKHLDRTRRLHGFMVKSAARWFAGSRLESTFEFTGTTWSSWQ